MAKSKIIKELASENVSLTIALKQLRVLLDEFDKPELIEWVDNELSGYKDKSEIPPYRCTYGVLKGNFLNYATYVSSASIPLDPNMPDNLKDYFKKVEFRESISGLKNLSSNSTQHEMLRMPLSGSLFPLIMEYSLVTMTAILNAWVEVGPGAVYSILSTVENKVLEIFLLLEKEFGCLDDLDIDLGARDKKDVENISNNIYLFIYNDKSLTIGNENEVKNSTLAASSNISTIKK